MGNNGNWGHLFFHTWFLNPCILFLFGTQNYVKISDSKHILCPRKMVPHSNTTLPTCWCFSCALRRPFHYVIWWTASGGQVMWYGQYILCLLSHPCSSFAIKWVSWSAVLCEIIAYRSGIVVLVESLRTEKANSQVSIYSNEKELLAFLDGRCPIHSTCCQVVGWSPQRLVLY